MPLIAAEVAGFSEYFLVSFAVAVFDLGIAFAMLEAKLLQVLGRLLEHYCQ